MFKSPRDLRQIDHFGRELKKVHFREDCYTQATALPHGHFLIDLDPKTSEVLRFGSIVTAAGPTRFHLPSAIAKETEIDNERERRAYSELWQDKKKQRKTTKSFFASVSLRYHNFV